MAQAQRHGARACLHKSAPAAELVAAILAAWRADDPPLGVGASSAEVANGQTVVANQG
jgi:DNA-binding NarL/FixJ family response regulator